MASLVHLLAENRFDTLHSPLNGLQCFLLIWHKVLMANCHEIIIETKLSTVNMLSENVVYYVHHFIRIKKNMKYDENCCAAFSLAQQQFWSKECTEQKKNMIRILNILKLREGQSWCERVKERRIGMESKKEEEELCQCFTPSHLMDIKFDYVTFCVCRESNKMNW